MKAFKLKFLVMPQAVANAILERDIKPLDLAVYAVIQSYSDSEMGCFASNETIAEWCGATVNHTQEAISRLRKRGFVAQEGFDGRKRYLRAVGTEAVEVREKDSIPPKKGVPHPPCTGDYKNSKIKTSLSGKKPDGESGLKSGFGVDTTHDENTTKEDRDNATKLESIVKKLPPRTTGISGTKPSTWARHFRLLRTKDNIPPKDVARVLAWYEKHIGEEYTPAAFSGESFRAKWEALERACSRDKTTTHEITPAAAKVAERVAGLGWPKGSASALPGAVAACLSAYAAWRAKRKVFMGLLESGKLNDKQGIKPKQLISFGNHLGEILPADSHFVEEWMRDVHGQIRTWAEWSGDLGQHIFKPTAKRFVAMGRGWAEKYCNDAGRWDRFTEIMEKETAPK